jgi:hypothetical protein
MGIIKSMMSEDDPLKFSDDYMHYIASHKLPRESTHDAIIKEVADIESDLVDDDYDEECIGADDEEEHDV